MGQTIINHQIRVKLKLNCLEYCMADFLQSGKSTGVSASDYLGISNNQTFELILELEKKGIIRLGEMTREASITDKWKNEFRVDGRIEEIWVLHRAGNKQNAIERLPKALKLISMDELKGKLKTYLKACAESNSFPKNLDTWLNPKKQYWNDPLPKRMPKPWEKPAQKQETNNYVLRK